MLSAAELQILGVSFGIALRAVLWSLPFAIALAYALSRRGFPGKSLLDAAAHLPLVLPPVLIGFFLLLAFGRRGPIGHWLESFGVHLAFTAEGAALATAVMILPLMVRAIRVAMEATDPGLIAAAALLRAAPFDRFFTVALPLAIYAALQAPNGDPLALRLAAISFACALAGLAGAEALQTWARRRREA